MLSWNTAMNLDTNESPSGAPRIGGSQEKAEAKGAEVAPADWHTLQAEGSARRHIDVLPVDEDRDSDGLRGNHSRGPASAAREPDGGEELVPDGSARDVKRQERRTLPPRLRTVRKCWF